ncbi:unnamed protein product [Lathyrus oleraceus]|nr:uncharacterized protein LOC127085886 isoform X2 [Pisum sativum]XP_050882404.1 uncharacterized protein LOC127085886 isoform X2 [Pisum sativum]
MGIEQNIDQEECRVGPEHNIDQEDSKTGIEHNMDQEESRMDTEHNMDQEESKTGTEHSNDQEESKTGTERNKKQEESRTGTEHNKDQEESRMGTEDNEDQEESRTGTEHNKEQEESRMGTEHNTDQEGSKMGTENLPEFSSNPNPQSSEKDDGKKDTDPAEGSRKPELSEKITPRSLKAKKIVKKSLVGIAKLKAKKQNSSSLILRNKIFRKNEKVVDNAESSHNADEKPISDITQQNKTKDEQTKEENKEAQNNVAKESQNRSSNEKNPMEESHQDKKDSEINLLDKTEQEQKNKEKLKESKKGSRRRRNKNKQNGKEKSLSNDKKSERLGGLIFMCSAKTKPDCFRYRVMGVSAAKKDDVLQIKPGLKLFLYDFDLKLLYGIYKASSSGGMKLEPKAFGGKFPAQVRFNIVSDSFPLPESIFKKAIKDNYNEKQKFKPELTVAQVRKLARLFRPVGAHSVMQPVYAPPKAIIREREVPGRVRGSQHHSHRERAAGHRSDRREDIPRDSFPMENYRAYDRRNLASTSHVNPLVEPYERDYEHRLPEPRYRSNVPAHVESLRRDPIYLNEREQQSYTRVVSDHINDPYAYRYGAPPRDAYLPPLRREAPIIREDISYLVGGRPFSGTDNLRRREIVEDRHYSIYSAADALPDYRPMQPYRGDKLEASPLRVSARYSFAGPSFSRR